MSEASPTAGAARGLPSRGARLESTDHERGLAFLARLALVGLQLGLLVVLVWAFEITSQGFLHLCILTFVGFHVHAVLPLRLRLPFFALLSLAGILLIGGLWLGAWMIGIGGALIALAHVPGPHWLRVTLVGAAGAAGAALFASDIELPFSKAIWPIVGSMFMFRMVIYLYDRSHEKSPQSPWTVLAYFFMLPNVCFPFFPIVDFKKFRSHHYDGDALTIYQRGVQWMFRGIYQLLIYRVVYVYLALDPQEVSGSLDFVHYSVSAYGLYLRVSGQFHLIIGMLLLFGFNLPETHHRYYLASSFTDLWRRINIYWKDFMLKLVYYPLYFRLRRIGNTPAILLSTGLVFVATWFLHAYQWFWLQGTLLFEPHDILFWLALALLVVIETRGELASKRRRPSDGPYAKAAHASRVAATFISMCALWGMWSSDSLDQWLLMVGTTGVGWMVGLLVILGLHLAARTLDGLDASREAPPTRRPEAKVAPGFFRVAAPQLASIAAVGLIGAPMVYGRLPTKVAGVIDSSTSSRLNKRDTALLERGYYEQLMGVRFQNAALAEMYRERPKDWVPLHESDIWQASDDMLFGSMKPNVESTFKRARFSTNRWGMRDRDYAKLPPEGTCRIALLGGSHTLGSGVSDDEVFEALVEARLNGEAAGSSYEILNFAGAGRSPIQMLRLLETTVLEFEPDMVFAVVHRQDERILLRYMAKLVQSGADIPYEYLADLVDSEGLDSSAPESAIRFRIGQHTDEIQAWVYQRIGQVARKNGMVPVAVMLPTLFQAWDEDDIEEMSRHPRDAGFEVVSLGGVYDLLNPANLRIAPWDDHPNARAHELLAERFHSEFRRMGLGESCGNHDGKKHVAEAR
jgi:D-alanyl-lipoteichoic acid acyltransferase DltB (MBOAT superfamily)